ncbi:MAG: LysE family translocator [Stackebrandtia sp.]
MNWHIFVTFGLALLPIIVTPGTSATLVAQYVSVGGRRHGAAVMAGTATGHVLHAAFATLGLSALVMASATAFAIVRYAGAAYLVGLGVYLLITASRKRRDPERPRLAPSVARAYRHALIGNVVNPRAALVYLTVPAQVVTVDYPVAAAAFMLAFVHTVMMVSWLSLWTQAISSAKRSGVFVRAARHFSRFGGLLLIGLGVRTAVSDLGPVWGPHFCGAATANPHPGPGPTGTRPSGIRVQSAGHCLRARNFAVFRRKSDRVGSSKTPSPGSAQENDAVRHASRRAVHARRATRIFSPRHRLARTRHRCRPSGNHQGPEPAAQPGRSCA